MVYGRVYCIRSQQTTDIYIGSTIQTLSQRMTDHRKAYKKYLNKNYDYMTSFEIVQYEDAYIEVLFEGEFLSRNDLDRKEGKYQREMDCVNKNIAGRTKKEHYEENTNLYKKKSQQYYEKKKEHIKKLSKKYAVEHRDHILEYQQKYQEEHKEQITEYKKQKITCECGTTVCIPHKARHERSKKHQSFIQSLSSEGNSS